MIKISELQYNIQVPLHDNFYTMPPFDKKLKEYELITTIGKTRDYSQQCDIYTIRLNKITNGYRNDIVAGYLYFSVDELKKSSSFYGVKIRSSYRGKGILNYLVSRWIEICLYNGIENLCTISRQRKPILLYSLKKMSFELKDLSLYGQGHDVYICKDKIKGGKVLFFENRKEGEEFAKSTINKETSHIIIPERSDRYEELAKLILENPYFAEDIDKAERISKETIKDFPDRIRL